MYDFNRLANRFIRVNYQDYETVLRRFVEYIEKTPVVHDYVIDCGTSTFTIADEIARVQTSYGRERFEFGESDDEETANIFALIRYLTENKWGVGIWQPYSNSRSYNDWAKEFNEQIVMILINHIEGYLTKIGIEMGMDENTRYLITVNNGQMNLAADNASITATQNNGISADELSAIIERIKKATDKLESAEDKEDAVGYIEVLDNELRTQQPKKGLIKTALAGLQAIKGSVEFGAAIAAIVQFVQTII